MRQNPGFRFCKTPCTPTASPTDTCHSARTPSHDTHMTIYHHTVTRHSDSHMACIDPPFSQHHCMTITDKNQLLLLSYRPSQFSITRDYDYTATRGYTIFTQSYLLPHNIDIIRSGSMLFNNTVTSFSWEWSSSKSPLPQTAKLEKLQGSKDTLSRYVCCLDSSNTGNSGSWVERVTLVASHHLIGPTKWFFTISIYQYIASA